MELDIEEEKVRNDADDSVLNLAQTVIQNKNKGQGNE
jgi:hypothetical protein